MVIAEIESEKPAVKTKGKDEKTPSSGVLQSWGLVVGELTEAQRKELKGKGGVRVDVATDAAARAGLREGDLIVAAANTEVASVRELENLVAKLDKSKPLSILYKRGEWTQYAILRITPR